MLIKGSAASKKEVTVFHYKSHVSKQNMICSSYFQGIEITVALVILSISKNDFINEEQNL